MSNIIFSHSLEKKDLEKFAKALYKENLNQKTKIEELEEKLKHLEELLLSVNVPTIGKEQTYHE